MSSPLRVPQPSPHILAAVAEAGARPEATASSSAEALVELAVTLQTQPRTPQDLLDAIFLYARAEELSTGDPVAQARAVAGRGVALRRMPGYTAEALHESRACLERALAVLREVGDPEEVAELEMNLGLVIHTLAGGGQALLKDAVTAYHAALRTFDAERYPREFATLHNNLATAYLAMRLAPDKEGLREALAVQSFQEALRVVNVDDDPVEYAMLQNNLGNALQAVPSAHRFANLARAIEAYDEALRVRTRYDMPVEHANTLVNKANAVMNLPDGPEADSNPENLARAIGLFTTAEQIFGEHGLDDRVAIVREVRSGLERELAEARG